MSVSIQEWSNGWTVEIDGYIGDMSQVCKTWAEVVRCITRYRVKHERALEDD
jgi:hypothetical protein